VNYSASLTSYDAFFHGLGRDAPIAVIGGPNGSAVGYGQIALLLI